MTDKIEKLIVKYLTNSATINDLDILSDWISKPANERMFKDYVQTYYAIICSMNKNDSQKTVEQLLRTIRKEKSFTHKLKTNVIYKYAVAASIILMVSITIFLSEKDNTVELTEPIIVNNQIESGTDKATLTLEDGTNVLLVKGETYQTQNAVSNGEQIIYNQNVSDKLIYNYLTTARGEQFQITLSDSTRVWLNSETQLKYPVTFTESKTREVELVYGEAYFDVSPSIDHKGSKFKVLNKAQEIEVLGTQFNIKAYKDETNIYTTLVEGKVTVTANDKNQILTPNQQSNLDMTTSNLSVANVDVKEEVAWINGEFIIQNKNLKEIMTVLSRWYDMDVFFANKDLEEVKFVGILRKNQNIIDILNTIKSFNVIKDYKISDKTVILK